MQHYGIAIQKTYKTMTTEQYKIELSRGQRSKCMLTLANIESIGGKLSNHTDLYR